MALKLEAPRCGHGMVRLEWQDGGYKEYDVPSASRTEMVITQEVLAAFRRGEDIKVISTPTCATCQAKSKRKR